MHRRRWESQLPPRPWRSRLDGERVRPGRRPHVRRRPTPSPARCASRLMPAPCGKLAAAGRRRHRGLRHARERFPAACLNGRCGRGHATDQVSAQKGLVATACPKPVTNTLPVRRAVAPPTPRRRRERQRAGRRHRLQNGDRGQPGDVLEHDQRAALKSSLYTRPGLRPARLPGRVGAGRDPAATVRLHDGDRDAARRRDRPGGDGRRASGARRRRDGPHRGALFGGASIDAHGVALTDAVLAACRAADAVLLGAVGGPKLGHDRSARASPRTGTAGRAQGPGPVREPATRTGHPRALQLSPLREERIAGTNLLVVRELTGGIYFGAKARTAQAASDVCEYTVAEVERIARVAFAAARTPRHQRRQGQRARDLAAVARGRRRECTARSSLASSCATCSSTTPRWRSSARPARFDVIVTENMFGDILSDEAAMITGSIGMLPSAVARRRRPRTVRTRTRLGARYRGQGIANPLAMFLSVALMLRRGLGLEEEAPQ